MRVGQAACLAVLLVAGAGRGWAQDVPAPSAQAAVLPAPDCAPAIRAAEARYGIPPGLLLAIGVVESGRRVAGTLAPWPWTVNAEGEGRSFETRDQAIAWVRQLWTRGVRSMDLGCLQVNLKHHPTAFASWDDAFDPVRNAEYAARFLLSLRDAAGDWVRAAGHYHSQTPDLAEPYRRLVLGALNGTLPPRNTQPVRLAAARTVLRLESTADWARRTAQAALQAAGLGRGGAEQARLQAVLMARAAPVVRVGAWSRPANPRATARAAEEARLNRARLAAGLPVPGGSRR